MLLDGWSDSDGSSDLLECHLGTVESSCKAVPQQTDKLKDPVNEDAKLKDGVNEDDKLTNFQKPVTSKSTPNTACKALSCISSPKESTDIAAGCHLTCLNHTADESRCINPAFPGPLRNLCKPKFKSHTFLFWIFYQSLSDNSSHILTSKLYYLDL